MALLAPLAWAEDAEEDDSWDFRWDKGFKLDSPGGDFRLKFGGRIVLDSLFPDADEGIEERFGPIEDAGEIRRARVFLSGSLYERVQFKMEYDFAGGEVDPTDVYVSLENSAGSLRIGHFYEPFSIEQYTSTKFITFIERALPNAFSPKRNVGVMLHDTVRRDEDGENGRLMWAAGVFRESDGFGFSSGDRWNATARLTGLPVYKDGGRRLVHLGLAFSHKEVDGERFSTGQRPEANLLPRFVDIGNFPAERADFGALEAAVNAGSFHAQGEYMWADVDATELGPLAFDGFYVQAGYFLTREHRPYDHGRASFDRLEPNTILGKEDGGGGAWEIAARFSSVDLTDGPVFGGVLDSVTLALNWYVNPVTRFQLNYGSSDLEGVGGVDFILVRLQVDF